MPANEQTWRDQKRMHVVFGVSSLVMLLATVWMLVADHNREWKSYQRGFRDVERFTVLNRINDEESTKYYAEEQSLDQELKKALSEPPSRELIEAFIDEADAVPENGYRLSGIRAIAERSTQARDALLESMRDVVKAAKQVEDNRQSELKFRRADLDVRRSNFEIGVRDEKPEAELMDLEKEVKAVQTEVDGLNLAYQNARDHRNRLQRILERATAGETAARKALSDHQANVKRLADTEAERANSFFKTLLESPIIDAFGRPLKVDNVWLPQLTWNNNFRDVARFDRCTTCHQGIEKTAPGSAVQPGYEPTLLIEDVKLATPMDAPSLTKDDETVIQKVKGDAAKNEKTIQLKLTNAYGLQLAERGLFDRNDATIAVVRPDTAAANALLEPGDVITMINGVKIINRPKALEYLLTNVAWGQPLTLQIRRGIPHPFSSHPRLDLFVGSLSPHKLGDVGCTICHEGQGTATRFKWASHTPSTPKEMERWSREPGWFNNHNWLFPMNPERFIESGCLKCHHEVTELEPSERFPDPPAPKLMEGYNIIRQFGCFGCHEINGFDSPSKRRGPDLRAEPPYFAAAAQLLTDPALGGRALDAEARPAGSEIRKLAREVIDHPELEQPRKRLAEWVRDDESLGKPKSAAAKSDEDEQNEKPHLRPESHKLATILGADEATPGQFRKVGPSLRYLSHKVDTQFLYNWIKNPTDFRPSTKMPRFFGLRDHLVDEPVREEEGVTTTELFEPIEIRAISEYLLAASSGQPFDYVPFTKNVAPPSVERGKAAFEQRGCLACHTHKDFPNSQAPPASPLTPHSDNADSDDTDAAETPAHPTSGDGAVEVQHTQGPDLSRIGAKLRPGRGDNDADRDEGDQGEGNHGERWLYSWVRDPNHYHARTVMPNTFLDQRTYWEKVGDEKEEVVSDPARDITAYLLQSQGWEPEALPDLDDGALDKLAEIFLAAAFSQRKIGEILKEGIDPELAADTKGDEALLVRDAADVSDDDALGDEMRRKKLLYVGRRTISRLGCSGCHDIPGFEDAKPIGTGLADWGRKDTSKLAFEMIVEYLSEHPHRVTDATVASHSSADGHGDGGGAAHGSGGHGEAGEAQHGLSVKDLDPDTGYFVEALLHHQREGFLWQKLREPRSYDFKKTENKSYIDRLRMPKFNFSQAQIEAVMTFVLGLVAEPPATKYVYQPSPRRKAIIEGEQLLTKYNCVGCHTLAMETWEFDFDPSKFPEPRPFKDYPFLATHFTPEQLAASQKTDHRGLGHAVVTGGIPAPTLQEDDDGNFYQFFLWEPVAINGKAWLVNDDVPVPADMLRKVRPPHGGQFARYVEPIAFKLGKPAKEAEAWGYVPPPLVREGHKVQTGWLHDFLLDPMSLRPKAVLRMPEFNMSSAEAGKLVSYFAAVDRVDAPYQYHRSGDAEVLSDDETKRLDEALNLVTEGTSYCVKCHLIGDYVPPKDPQGPNLSRVYQRLRPEYLREWLAKPSSKLPYTGMPVNFPREKDPNETLRTRLFAGTSEEALDGVLDLLLNYDAYMERQKSIKAMVKEPPPAPDDEKAASARTSPDDDAASTN
ncbi:MAG TPA: PDZ domain-containing protein [Pirellulales bacterium]|nr:PDZ domain-containing protein [Pirellulales bacterium]